MRKCMLLLALSAFCAAAKTTVVFQPESLTAGPFPSNALTVPDSTQVTGMRINLPNTEDACTPPGSTLDANAVVCSNNSLLNQLDGFSENPRLMVCFSAAVDPNTLPAGIWITPLNGSSGPIKANQILFDPVSNCAYAKPNQVLAQSSTYLLTVTDSVHDTGGASVAQADAFTSCLASSDAYCQSLASAIGNFPNSQHVMGGSVFTTMTSTTWLEKARDFANQLPRIATPAGSPSTFRLSDISSMTWNADQSGQAPSSIPLNVLTGVGQVAFGLYLSPNFLAKDGTISFGPTKSPLLPPASGLPLSVVSFHVLLPATPAPKGGYPVILYGHGLGDNQFGATTYFAGQLAKQGFATVAIEVMGQGYGPNSTVKVTANNGQVYTELTPGRGVLQPGSTTIGPSDGCLLVGNVVATRDCNLQTAVDLITMVNNIRNGLLGLSLNANRIYYVGQSEGSIYGTLFNAVEPYVHAAALSVGGGSSADIARYAIAARPLGDAYLAPLGLLNVLAGTAPPQQYFNDGFNDNYVYRDQPPVVNQYPSVLAVQAAFEAADWLQMRGDPLSFAAHLSAAPLKGVPAKSTLFLFSKGDLEVPNPANSALIRAAHGESQAWFLQFDKAIAIATAAGFNDLMDPHPLLSFPTIFDSADQTSIALAEQQQVGAFFAADGKANPNPNAYLAPPFNGQQLFVIPNVLPEQLNYFQLSGN